jgi:hypothetical protein
LGSRATVGRRHPGRHPQQRHGFRAAHALPDRHVAQGEIEEFGQDLGQGGTQIRRRFAQHVRHGAHPSLAQLETPVDAPRPPSIDPHQRGPCLNSRRSARGSAKQAPRRWRSHRPWVGERACRRARESRDRRDSWSPGRRTCGACSTAPRNRIDRRGRDVTGMTPRRALHRAGWRKITHTLACSCWAARRIAFKARPCPERRGRARPISAQEARHSSGAATGPSAGSLPVIFSTVSSVEPASALMITPRWSASGSRRAARAASTIGPTVSALLKVAMPMAMSAVLSEAIRSKTAGDSVVSSAWPWLL